MNPRRMFFKLILLVILASSCSSKQVKQEEELFTPAFTSDIESFRSYKYPEWFRDAKFGIFVHWGPATLEFEGKADATDAGTAPQ